MAPQQPNLNTASARAKAGQAADRRRQMMLGVGAGGLLLVCGVYLSLRIKAAVDAGHVVIASTPESEALARPFAEDYDRLRSMTIPELQQEMQRRESQAQAGARSDPGRVNELTAAMDRCQEILSEKQAERNAAPADAK